MQVPNSPLAGYLNRVAAMVLVDTAGLRAPLRRLAAALETRRQRRALMALDDRMLADIGVSRSVAYREASRSMFDLPRQ